MALPRFARRLFLPLTIAAEAGLLGLVAAAGVIGLLISPLDRRLRLLRLALMGGAYIVIEWAGLAWLLWIWMMRPLRGPGWWDTSNVEAVGRVLGAILGVAKRTVGLRVEIDQPCRPGPFQEPDPVLVLARHGGIGDSFVLVWLLASLHRRRPRVVLKRILQWEPLIDVALTRMGACFLPPNRVRHPATRPTGPDHGERLDARVAALAEDLRPGDALLLFPEGGNWTPRRRIRAIRKLWASRKQTAARAAALMDHVLPPRAGGVLACLEARPEIPVVVVAHTGLDKITTPGQLWSAVPFSVPMSLRWWPPTHPPYGKEERIHWLTTEWAVIDQWIDTRESEEVSRPSEPAPLPAPPVSGRGR